MIDISGMLGFGVRDQARIATAVSELARTMCIHAAGKLWSYNCYGAGRRLSDGASPAPADTTSPACCAASLRCMQHA